MNGPCSQPPVVLFTDGAYFTPQVLERYFSKLIPLVELRLTTARTSDELTPHLQDVDILVARRVQVGSTAFDAAPRLRGIQSWGVGVDSIDIEAATQRGIPVANSPGNAPAVAEATFALLLAVTKQLPLWIDVARTGNVPDGETRGTELLGKTIGIVGYGRIGQRVAHIARAFGMHILAYDPYVTINPPDRGVDLDQLLGDADIVSLHCVLTPENRHLIDERRLALMKRSSVLINTARGALVDEAALIRALEAGLIAGAGLDVFEAEPPDPAHPLLHFPNVVATPHALPRTWESGERTAAIIVEGVMALIDGQLPPNTLNPQVHTRF